MKEEDKVYLEHIASAIAEIYKFTENGNNDHKTFRAVERSIEIIGEASRKISKETQAQFPQIPWADIIGMRNKIAHDYFGVDEDTVWAVVDDDLPELEKQIQQILTQVK